ncbi:uncharacterized protein HMPREF1541_01088 [Cyphellophora europaea CBS 101466]|uniref:Thioredoxin-like fold domain-containing protein n=1 Tax=Cyphellophora europaea (strain CBS 101466) TaxID=1220924 RepID=W2SGA7_CYPE1|nr:uncharacterized protein HMPREF1541_01088 [Cyphellophora europaea CBS 101466]ETN46899.1 hypothetical protein HMPREF1541_01088 [Cyphellophora europaea CBS 101466]
MGSVGTASHSSKPTYSTLSTPLKGTPPPVIVFFSFLDHTSHRWATQCQVTQNIRRSLPAGTSVHRHHVSSTDKSGFNWGQDLTRAWAVAMHLRVDDRIIASLFEKVLVEKTVIDLEGLRDCFERDGGVDKVRFDRAWNDAGVVADAKYQDELSEGLPREKLPCIVVRGRRMVDGNELSHMDRDADFGPKVGELVRELLSLEE